MTGRPHQVPLLEDTAIARRPDVELRMDVAAAIESLPEHYRTVVVLRDFRKLKIDEIRGRGWGLAPGRQGPTASSTRVGPRVSVAVIRRHPGVGEQRSENTGMAPVSRSSSCTNGIEGRILCFVPICWLVSRCCWPVRRVAIARRVPCRSGCPRRAARPARPMLRRRFLRRPGTRGPGNHSYLFFVHGSRSMRLFVPLLLAVLFFPSKSACWTAAWGHRPRHNVSQICVTGTAPSPVNDARDAALSNLPGDLLQLLE